jgi:hypothetical protein
MDASIGQLSAYLTEVLDSKKLLLAGPAAENLKFSLDKYDFFEGRTELALETQKGYAGILIGIAKKNGIFDNDDNSNWLFSGPEYIRKSDAEINSYKK